MEWWCETGVGTPAISDATKTETISRFTINQYRFISILRIVLFEVN